MKKTIYLLLAVLLAFSTVLASCNGADQASGDSSSPVSAISGVVSDEAGQTVSLEIDCKALEGKDEYPEGGFLLSATEVTLADGMTAFSLLSNECKARKLQLAVSGDSGSEFITSIGGIENSAFGDMSGWYYTVNGEMPTVGCGQYELKDGDKVVFAYTLDFNELWQ